MLKTGIHDICQLTSGTRLNSLLSRKKVISVSLYDKIQGLPNADTIAEQILLLHADERGAFKRTCGSRFEAFESDFMQRLLHKYYPAEKIIIADVAVSDGRTSCDFFEKIVKVYPDTLYYASDFEPQLFVIQKGRVRVTLNKNNTLIETVWPPFVFTASKRENILFFPVNRLIRKFVNIWLARPLIDDYVAKRVNAHELLLFSNRALTLRNSDSRFCLGEHNILNPLSMPEVPHIIRAMNILNETYFSASDFGRILSNFHASLRKGGWLVTGSNQDAGSVVHGGIYEKTGKGFIRIWCSGNGSPVEDHILTYRPVDINN